MCEVEARRAVANNRAAPLAAIWTRRPLGGGAAADAQPNTVAARRLYHDSGLRGIARVQATCRGKGDAGWSGAGGTGWPFENERGACAGERDGWDEGAVYVRPRAMRAATWSETWSERVRLVVDDRRGNVCVAHGGQQQEHVEVVVAARDGAKGGGAAEVGAAARAVRVVQAASAGMFWLQHDTPAACVVPGLELEEGAQQQQQVQLEGEQDADGDRNMQQHLYPQIY